MTKKISIQNIKITKVEPMIETTKKTGKRTNCKQFVTSGQAIARNPPFKQKPKPFLNFSFGFIYVFDGYSLG